MEDRSATPQFLMEESEIVKVQDSSTTKTNADGFNAGSCACCRFWGFNVATLTVIQLVFAVISAITSAVLMQQSYNTVPSSNWIMIGGVTSTSATARVRTSNSSSEQQYFIVSENEDLSNPIFEGAVSPSSDYVQSLNMANLSSRTRYYYGIDNLKRGSFETPGPEGEPFNFRVVAAGCAWTGSTHSVFSQMANERALLYVLLGDMHYEDISVDDLGLRIHAIDTVLGSPSQAQLFASAAFAYMWDDHDWLGNDSEGEGPGRESALQSYQIAIPRYSPLPDNSSSLPSPYQAFTIGRVRFILMDLRSQATDTSIYSPAQKEWLFGELDAAFKFDFVVLVSSKPWIDVPSNTQQDDSWAAYPSNRSELSERISNLRRHNLLMIASDAHMVAFDDGSNTYYGRNSSAMSFPLLQTGPMDRLGSAKGGPFSDGCYTVKYERNHQYSVLDFSTTEDNQTCLEITSKDSTGRTILSRTMCGDIFHNTADKGIGSCSASTVSSSMTAMLGASCALLVLIGLGSSYFIGCRTGLVIFFVCVVLAMATFAIGIGIPLAKGISQFDTVAIAAIVLTQICVTFLFVVVWARCTTTAKRMTD